MISLSLSAEPSQTLSVTLNAQSCQIAVYRLGVDDNVHLYLDLSVAGVPIITGKVCRNLDRMLLGSEYRGFQGDLMFIDTQGDTDPVYTGLGTRYELLYLSPAEL
jgi:hypothetical protein